LSKANKFSLLQKFSDEGFNFRGAYLRISERTFKNSSSTILGDGQKHHLTKKKNIFPIRGYKTAPLFTDR